MARISDESKERVRQAVDIVEVVSAHTDLRRQGVRWLGLCPFHEERTPSFSVNPQDKLYHCFGCGVGGDVFKFVEEKEGIDFPAAVELLAERYGVELEREQEDPRAEAARRRRARIGELLERTADFYASLLWNSPQAAKARSYLEERGLGEEVLRDFGVGLAPGDWGTVLERGQRAGYSIEEMQEAGLLQKGRTGGIYDRFRSRIMFPVRDPRGRVLGFGARALRPDQQPKYVNSKESTLYRKSETLFGIDKARAAIAKAGRGIVVEGYTDALALHQAGVTEAVAVMGTAITSEQIAMLSGIVEELVLALDADSAGQEAMLRAQRVAEGRRMRIGVAAMPAGEDPADMLTEENGAERFRALVDGAVELPAFQVELVLAATDVGSPAARDRALAQVAPVLAAMGETASRDELIRRVGERLDMEVAIVVGRLAAPAVRSSGREEEAPARIVLTPREGRERALLAMCIAEPKEGRVWLEKLTAEHLTPLGAKAVEWLRGHLDEPLAGLPRDDEELLVLISELVMVAEREPASAEAMELNFMLLEQRRLEGRISEAGEKGDYERRAELNRERAALVERIAHAERVAS